MESKPPDALPTVREHWKAELLYIGRLSFEGLLAALEEVSNHAESAADSSAMALVRER